MLYLYLVRIKKFHSKTGVDYTNLSKKADRKGRWKETKKSEKNLFS